MEENHKITKINVSDEGVIFIDGLKADIEAFHYSLMEGGKTIEFDSDNGYQTLVDNYREFLIQEKLSMKAIHQLLDLLEFLREWQIIKQKLNRMADKMTKNQTWYNI